MTKDTANDGSSSNRGSDSDHDSAHLELLLDHLGEAGDTDDKYLKVASLIDVVGSRSFSPLLMLVGLMIMSPLSGIPALPTVAAVMVLLVTVQMLMGRRHFWLPDKLLQAEVSRGKLTKALKWLKPVARFVDRITRPRLTVLIHKPASYVLAVLCIVIAALMPLMELIPFSSSAAGAVLALFGIALVARDGLMALLGYAILGATAAAIFFTLG